MLNMFKKLILFGLLSLATFSAFAQEYNTSLNTIIEDETVADTVQALRTAREGDVVYINITSPGGSVTSMEQVIKAMKETKALTIARVTKYAASAAAMIATKADILQVNPEALILFHDIRMMDILGHINYV